MNVLIVFTSMTGNTELMTKTIGNELRCLGFSVTEKDAFEAETDGLDFYDVLLIGSYTWGDGDLPDEIVDFYEELGKLDLTDKEAAVFGSGDSSYEHFARAVDIFEESLKDQGCHILLKGLKVDRESDEVIQEISKTFAQQLAGALQSILLKA